jgi:hypothetical protein
MKKLLVLMIVLALASLANAVTITGDYNSTTKVISVSVADNEGSLYLGISVTDGDGVVGSFGLGADAPASSENFDMMGEGQYYPDNGEGELWTMVHVSGTPVYVDGEWLVATFSGSTPSTVTVWSFVEDGEVFTEEEVIVIPEPATIALLCLGGLLIRKK